MAEQVLHRIHFDVTLDQGGRHGGFADVLGPGRDFHYRIQVGAAEHDTGVHRRRFQGQVNLFPECRPTPVARMMFFKVRCLIMALAA